MLSVIDIDLNGIRVPLQLTMELEKWLNIVFCASQSLLKTVDFLAILCNQQKAKVLQKFLKIIFFIHISESMFILRVCLYSFAFHET